MRATWAGDESIETNQNQTPKRKPPQRRITVVGINASEDPQSQPETGGHWSEGFIQASHYYTVTEWHFTDRPLNLSLGIFLGSYKQMHLNKLKKNYGSTGKINTSTIGGLDLAEVERGILIYNVAPLHKSYSTIKRNIILVYYPAIPVI